MMCNISASHALRDDKHGSELWRAVCVHNHMGPQNKHYRCRIALSMTEACHMTMCVCVCVCGARMRAIWTQEVQHRDMNWRSSRKKNRTNGRRRMSNLRRVYTDILPVRIVHVLVIKGGLVLASFSFSSFSSAAAAAAAVKAGVRSPSRGVIEVINSVITGMWRNSYVTFLVLRPSSLCSINGPLGCNVQWWEGISIAKNASDGWNVLNPPNRMSGKALKIVRHD